jgi:ribosomal 50S subunit-recycling heat shock protein
VAKPGSTVKEGDIVEIRFGENSTRFRVKKVAEHMRKEETGEMIEIL